MAEKEQVNHPGHYGGANNPYEAIKVIDAWDLSFCLGNTAKYISRAGKKEQDKIVQDLQKALWYLEHEIELKKANIEGNFDKLTDLTPGTRVVIPACVVEFNVEGNTIWVQSPHGATILRIQTNGKINISKCKDNPCSNSDMNVPEDINICLANDAFES